MGETSERKIEVLQMELRHSRNVCDTLFATLHGIHALLPIVEPITANGVAYTFKLPEALLRDTLTELTKRIREIPDAIAKARGEG